MSRVYNVLFDEMTLTHRLQEIGNTRDVETMVG